MRSLPRLGAVTMVRNEGRMIHKWVDHYGSQLGHDNLLVLDDSSDDGSTDDLPCRVEPVAPIVGDFEPERMKIVSRAATRLLRAADGVVFADADEFIVPDPARYDGLRDFAAARADREAVGVMCLNVVHHTATEPALDFAAPVLGSRSLVKLIPLFCKPSLKLVDRPWAAASHGISGAQFVVDDELFMFHLKFADRAHLAKIAEHRRSMVELDGRASATSWQFTSDEMLDLLDRLNDEVGPDPSVVPEFAPDPDRLGEIVVTNPNGVTRATGARMVPAMNRRPFRRIPARFRTAV